MFKKAKYVLIGISMIGLFMLSCGSSSSEISRYHSLVNLAEKSIINQQFEEANNYYEEAFSLRKTPFSTDIYNRIIVNFKIGEIDEAFSYLERLVVTTGISQKKIKEHYRFLLLYPEESERFYSNYEQYLNEHRKSLNDHLKQIYEEIQVSDQEFRKTGDRYTKYKAINHEIDSTNALKLIDLFREYGYPSEMEIGVLELEDRRKGFGSILTIATLHAFQNCKHQWTTNIDGNQLKVVDVLRDLLEKEVHKGNLHPELFLLFQYGHEMHCKKSKTNIYDPPITIINGNKYYKPLTASAKDSLNDIRKKWMLDSMDDYYAKSFYSANNPGTEFELDLSGCCVTYHLQNPEDEELTAEIHQVVPYK